MTDLDLDLDEIERLHPDEPGINPFVRPLVAEVRRLRNIGSPFGIDRTLDEFRDHLAADLAGPGVRPYVDEMFSALVARTNERDEARASIAAVRALHYRVTKRSGDYCDCEGEDYPCATIRALDVRHGPSATTEGAS